MNYKYIIIGINTVFASIVAIGIALYVGYESLLGVGFSLLTLGLILSGIGLTFIEPLDRFYKDMARIHSLIINKVFDDTGLIYGHHIQTCLDKGLVVIAKSRALCGSLSQGLGIVDGSPYVALPIDFVLSDSVNYVREEHLDLRLLIRDVIINLYGMGRDLYLKRSGNRIKVGVHGVRSEVLSLIKQPLNPFKIAVVALVAKHTNSDVVLEKEELLENDYILEIRMV